MVAEFAQAFGPDEKYNLCALLLDTLRGVRPIPAGWLQADVSLMPKAAQILDAKAYRPITVLPVCLKLCLKIWMHSADKYLSLRHWSSQGFRRGFRPQKHILLCARSSVNIWSGRAA